MNRGFGFYFGNAIRTAASTIWKKGNIIRFFAYFFMELLARVTLVFSAIFDLANVRQAKIAHTSKEIDVPQSFKIACRRESLRTMIMCIIVEALIFIAGLLIIGAASGMLYAIGYVISLFIDTVSADLLTLIFLAPGALVTLVYFIIMPMMFAPTPYVIETNPDISVADTISACFNTMKSKGKFTYFLNLFIPALVEGAIISVGYVSIFLVNLFVADYQLAMTLNVVLILITFVAFILVAPMFALARRISTKSLFEDIVLDPVNASRRTNGVNIKKCKGVKFDPSAIENELVLLFDETSEDRVPMPVSPAEARRRQKEAQKRAKEAAQYAQPVQPAQAWTPSPAPEWKPANQAPATPAEETPHEEEEQLITVSDVIGEPEPQMEEPVQEETPVEEVQPVEETAETAEEAQIEEAEEPAEETTEPEAEEPADEQPAVEEPEVQEPAEEVKEEKPAPRTASKTSATKAAATKATASKTAATKTAAAKTTASKSTATKATTAKTTASKPSATKSTTAKTTATKSAASKTTAAKTTASKTATAKKTTSAKSSKPAAK